MASSNSSANTANLISSGGGVISAFGAYLSGQAEERAQRMNAEIARDNADQAILKAQDDARRLRLNGAKVLGDMRAAYGASGVTMEGSPLEVMKQSAANVELDALNALYMGEEKARAFRNEARMSEYRGDFASTAGKFGAASSLLSSAAQMAKAGG